MPLRTILGVLGNKMGLNPANPDQRSVLLRFVNEAAQEMYRQSDMSGILVEQVFKVNGDQTIAMPSYVGPLRAIREMNSTLPWHINRLRPRYNAANWMDMWRNWRLMGRSPVIRSIDNEAQFKVVVSEAQPGVFVSIAGSTPTASRVTENIELDQLTKQTQNSFLTIDVVNKTAVTTCDVTITDLDGNVTSIIPNHELQAEYQIIDVSTLPWLPQSNDQLSHYVEVLYKKKLPPLLEDGDEYPAQGYDYVLINKSMQLWCEEQGKTDEALAYDAKASRTLHRINQDENAATEDTVAFVANNHDQLLMKVRNWHLPYGRRYGGIG